MNIAVIPNIKKAECIDVIKKLRDVVDGRARLITSSGVFIDGIDEVENVYTEADVAIVLGGDGSMLMSAVPCAGANVPMMGINLGRIGFMSEIEIPNIQMAIDRLLAGDYRTEERMMMDISCINDGVETMCGSALNDTVISKKADVKLISTELLYDSEKLCEYVCDGLIIASPTGSTGYNISAGGPVVNPTMNLFAATAICPHMLSSRPMIIPADSHIHVRLDDRLRENEALVVVDGEVKGKLCKGDEVIISKSKLVTKLIKFDDSSFYDVLINKLH